MERIAKELRLRATSLRPVAAKLHLYSISSDSAADKSVSIRLDGKRVGSLPVGHYACFSLSPGLHSVETNKDELKIDAIPGDEYYVGVHAGPAVMTPTEGYQIAGPPLQPVGRRTLKDLSPCF